MPMMTGFELISLIESKTKVIITTAYNEYALKGYELNVTDYLLKPFSFERFLKAINKTISTVQNKKDIPTLSTTETKADASSIFFKGDKKHHQIHFDDLLFIEAYGHYCKVYLKNDMIISHQKISDFEQLLPKFNFIRTHKSFIAAKDKIKQIEGNRILIDKYVVPIGQTYKENIMMLL